jgi:hypothetical protein
MNRSLKKKIEWLSISIKANQNLCPNAAHYDKMLVEHKAF